MLECYKKCKKYERNEIIYSRCVEECIKRSNERRRSLTERLMDYVHKWTEKEYERGYWRI